MWGALFLAAAFANPYGVVVHATRSEATPYRLEKTVSALQLAGLGWIRTDFDAASVLRGDTFDFTKYDHIFGTLGENGIAVLPIFNGRDGKDPPKDLAAYRAYLTKALTHYRGRFPVVEIWNEANLEHFFPGHDPVVYARVLRVAYETVKQVDPSVRVAFTGTAGVPIDWIRKAFEAGAASCFDIMNVHPYTHPHSPEGDLDVKLGQLAQLMASFGIGDKPVWITEIGWPTHEVKIHHASILQAGLNVARPDKKVWRVLLLDGAVDHVSDQRLAEEIMSVLPPGSTAEAVGQKEAVRRLDAGGWDAVVYPFDESFPADTIDAVNRFIADGGVFVDMGGLPCYFGVRGTEKVPALQHGRAVSRFPFDFGAEWTHRDLYPAQARVFATPRGLAAGVKQEPTGFRATRFVRPKAIDGQEWIPLVSARREDGREIVAAAVIRYTGARKGAAILCSLFPERGTAQAVDETVQAWYTARALGISFASGVEAFCAYNLRAVEVDSAYSEHHFGLMHADFQPKPAYAAYAQFVRMRPPGAVRADGAWRDAARRFYFPQWTRPDGKAAGMLWQTSGRTVRTLTFEGGKPSFFNVFGRRIQPRAYGDGRYGVGVDGSPVYFSGAKLVSDAASATKEGAEK